MNLTAQLRIIMLLAGGVLLLLIYLLGRRHGRKQLRSEYAAQTAQPFPAAAELDEDELDTPAYMRRNTPVHLDAVVGDDWDDSNDAVRTSRRVMPELDDFDDALDEASDAYHKVADLYADQHTRQSSQPYSGKTVTTVDLSAERAAARPFAVSASPATTPNTSIATATALPSDHNAVMDVAVPVSTNTQMVFDEPIYVDDAAATSNAAIAVTEAAALTAEDSVAPAVEVQHHEVEEVVIAAEPVPQPLPVTRNAQPVVVISEPPTIPSIKPDTLATPAVAAVQTPTLSEVARSRVTKPAPTTNKPSAKRKIIALRLQVPQRVAGTMLLELMQQERLEHGKFNIFHRQHGDAAVFSVASMVEPGSFDVSLMPEQQFPGVTLFMLLPGPLDGLIAYDQMLSCAQRMANTTGGHLQDERGTRLNTQLIERLREEVLNFQHLLGE